MIIPSFHWTGASSFSQILLNWLYSMLTAVSMSALMASAGISYGPAAFPLLRVMMASLVSAFEGLSQLMGSSVSAEGMSGGESGVGRFSSSEVFCPSFQLFLGCCQWVPFLVHHWLFCLLEFAGQLLGHQIQVPQIHLSGCSLCLSS